MDYDFEKAKRISDTLFKHFADNAHRDMFEGSMGEIGKNAHAVKCVVNGLAHASALMCVADVQYRMMVKTAFLAMTELFMCTKDEAGKTLASVLAEVLKQALEGLDEVEDDL